MPCPHANGTRSNDDEPLSKNYLSRRQMIRAAVAIGGTSGLSACLSRERDVTTTTEEPAFPTGRSDLASLPERQHAWVEWLVRDRFGNTVLPQHQTMLLLEYTGPTPPDENDRATVEKAFRTLERAFQRGMGGDESAVQHEGLLFVVGYAPTYFDRFDADLPESIDLPPPEVVIDELDETEPTADSADAVVHLAAGFGSVLLAAEEALTGERDVVNGVTVDGTLADHFAVRERRTGFFGRAQPAQRYDNDDIPETAPLSMGFKSNFGDTLPSEDTVTIQTGPFAGGTTMQVSRLEHDLETWYDQDAEAQIDRMFSPAHDEDLVGEVGENLAGDSEITEDIEAAVDDHARESGVVGHGQKLAHARNDEFSPPILRRDFNPTATPGLHFDSWQRRIEDFLSVRRAMNGDHVEDAVEPEADGILAFIEVTNRATFLMPPRSRRALPSPHPD